MNVTGLQLRVSILVSALLRLYNVEQSDIPETQRGAPERPPFRQQLLQFVAASLELEAYGQLRFTWVAHALADEPVEIKQRRAAAADCVYVVFVVEQVEDLHLGVDLEPLSKVKWSCRPKIKRKVDVILAKEVPSAIDVRSAWAKANLHAMRSLCVTTKRPGASGIGIGTIGLRRVRLHSHVNSDLPRQFGVRDEVEFMFFVAVGIGIFLREIVNVIIVKAEWISFVGIIVQIFRPDVIRIQLESIVKALAHPNRCAAIERLCGTGRVGNRPQIREWGRARVGWSATEIHIGGGDQIRSGAANVGISKPGQMNSLGDCEVKVAGQARRERLLLHSVRRDGPDLRKHILPGVVDPPARTQGGLAIPANVPSEADPRLKHLVLVVQCSIGRKLRVAQVRAVRSLCRRNNRTRKAL